MSLMPGGVPPACTSRMMSANARAFPPPPDEEEEAMGAEEGGAGARVGTNGEVGASEEEDGTATGAAGEAETVLGGKVRGDGGGEGGSVGARAGVAASPLGACAEVSTIPAGGMLAIEDESCPTEAGAVTAGLPADSRAASSCWRIASIAVTNKGKDCKGESTNQKHQQHTCVGEGPNERARSRTAE